MSVIQFFVFLKILFRENQNTAHEITQKPIKYISTKMKKNVANAHSKRIFSTFKGHLFTVTLATSLLLASNLQLQAQNIKEIQSLPHASLSATHPQSPISDLAAKRTEWKKMKGDVVLYMANDLGRNGYYDQKPIAELMGTMAETIGPECILAVGDIHHFNGVASISDPLWTTNYEQVYSHPELMLDWFPVLGNHEYRGNTQAVLDYGKVSRRWMMPARYYTKVFNHKNTTIRVVFLDTTPLIDRYQEDNQTYPDACKQNMQAELNWLDATLKTAHEDWVIVVGHHPIYAYTTKEESERTDMQKRVLPILKRYNNVALYACGHIHNFQHIKIKGDNIDYVVNTAASLARPVQAIEGTVFCSNADGYSVISASKQHLNMYMIDKDGNIIHEIVKNK